MILNPKRGGFMIFWQFFFATKWIEIDQDNLRTGTAIDSRTFHEH